jgi:hypothetical protein
MSTITGSVTEVTLQGTASGAARHRALIFGWGFGIAVGAKSLEAAVVRARPNGPTLAATRTIRDFRTRPAAEWGAELAALLSDAGEAGLAATVVLPRDEVIVRVVHLPGVAEKDIPAAIELQIDTLHPWGDEEVVWGWSRVNAAGVLAGVLVGLARKASLDTYETLFAEAGILLAAVTFSPAVIHSALRFWNAAPASLLCYTALSSGVEATGADRGRIEIYGESEGRGIYSAEFPGQPERAFAIARAELRLPSEFAATPLAPALPAAAGNVSIPSPVAYAAAVAGAAPRRARVANLLPPERRAAHNRGQYILPVTLGVLLALGLIAVFILFPALDNRRYRAELEAAARRLEPTVLLAQGLDKKAAAERARTAALDDLRHRPQADLDVLNELTRLLQPPVWTNTVEIYPDSVVLAGEADQAAPLLRVLDSSPLFQNSEFVLPVSRSGQIELFRIKTSRRGRQGRVTP